MSASEAPFAWESAFFMTKANAYNRWNMQRVWFMLYAQYVLANGNDIKGQVI